jgi:nifR3 family TIM-barrel protein
LIVENAAALKIGSLTLSNPLLLAPLSGISNLPFRLLAKEQGCGMVCTEMISADGLLRNRRASERLLKSCPEERPLAAQIFGSKPDSMAEAAKVIEGYGVEVLDINMGCPVRKVVKGGSGAALLKDSKRVAEILRSVRKAISIPLTVKIRSGWDEKSINFLEIARVGEECGVDGLTLHGRTRTQGYGTEADWEVIAQTKRHLRIPVIGSGDLTSPEAIHRFFAQTNADGAMIGRGAMGNPWIFRQALQILGGYPPEEPSLEEKERTVLRHLRMMTESQGEVHGAREFRKHLIWYTRGLRGSSEFRAQIPHWETFSEVVGRIQEYFHTLRNSPPQYQHVGEKENLRSYS